MRLNFTANSFVFGRTNRGKCAQNILYKARKEKASKMRLNFTANRFIFGLTNRGIAPRTFPVKLAGRELPICV